MMYLVEYGFTAAQGAVTNRKSAMLNLISGSESEALAKLRYDYSHVWKGCATGEIVILNVTKR